MTPFAAVFLGVAGLVLVVGLCCCLTRDSDPEPHRTFEESFPGHKLGKNGRPPLELMFPNAIVEERDPFLRHSAPPPPPRRPQLSELRRPFPRVGPRG